MTPFETVVIGLLAGAFLVVLVSGLVIVIWSAYQVKQTSKKLETAMAEFSAETALNFNTHEKAMAIITESGKSSLQSIRQEMRSLMSDHQKAMKETVRALNGDALIAASKRIISASVKFERIAGVLQGLLVEREEAAGDYDVEKPWPDARAEEMAPEGPPSFIDTESAVMEQEARQEENSEVLR